MIQITIFFFKLFVIIWGISSKMIFTFLFLETTQNWSELNTLQARKKRCDLPNYCLEVLRVLLWIRHTFIFLIECHIKLRQVNKKRNFNFSIEGLCERTLKSNYQHLCFFLFQLVELDKLRLGTRKKVILNYYYFIKCIWTVKTKKFWNKNGIRME